MSFIYTFLTGLLVGAVVGVLAYRNNADRLKATEEKVKTKTLLDILKGR
jgi:NhaP-type Na+/H+ or K+/H+ antiporter